MRWNIYCYKYICFFIKGTVDLISSYTSWAIHSSPLLNLWMIKNKWCILTSLQKPLNDHECLIYPYFSSETFEWSRMSDLSLLLFRNLWMIKNKWFILTSLQKPLNDQEWLIYPYFSSETFEWSWMTDLSLLFFRNLWMIMNDWFILTSLQKPLNDQEWLIYPYFSSET